ncbi:MAG: glutamate-1-semialdehyde 2,1-aminomutase [Acidobacteria bacterium]|nr:glutamate-1-semialdehyde 2,1-aminomutase [Acidobacteriota bacterium]
MSHDTWHARALAAAPGGVHSPVRSFRSVGGTPVYVQRAEGPWLVAVDGRRFIDFCMSFGPLMLGHRDPDVRAAAVSALEDGWTYGAAEPYSVQLAEWMLTRLPFIDRVRFVSSGTEAVMSALRVARAATGRPAVVKFEGCYHGHVDGMLVQAGSGLAGESAASSAGLPPSAIAETLVLPLDDERALDQLFEAHGSRIAAVIVEPLPANYGLLPQRRAFLEHVRARCRAAGALLILDEVISGFRVGLTGIAGAWNLDPDLVCYGKVIGGGFPLAAYAGKREFMEQVAPSGPVYQAGTLSANPVAVRAGLASLSKLEAVDGWRVLDARAAAFCASLDARFASLANGPGLVRQGSLFWFTQTRDARPAAPAEIPGGQAEWFARFFHQALARGVYLPPSGFEVCFLSLAHDEAVLAEAAGAIAAAAEHT